MNAICASCGSSTCGCCTGVDVAVPSSEANPPGLTALTYRAGTYATFYETMLARLTGLVLQVPSASGNGTDNVMPLAGLTTRDPSDPSIALLDAWAVVADVLTFYQERIANEGYLPTAIERRSLLELSRLIGYRLRPGVSASVKLAFTVSTGFTGTLPAGTRAQSIPGTGQAAQFFETSAALDVRDTWNALAPRLTRPQLITPASTTTAAGPGGTSIPLVTGADVIDTVYIDGVTTGLSPGDALLFIFGPITTGVSPAQQYLRLAADVGMQANQSRTEVTLALQDLGLDVADELQLYVDKANYLFPGSDIAAQVVAVLTPTIANLLAGAQSATDVLQGPRSRIALLQGTAVQRGFTRVAAWLSALLQVMQWASLGGGSTLSLATRSGRGKGDSPFLALPQAGPASALAGLGQIIGNLAQPPSRQPANALRLQRSVTTSFAPQSDNAPRLLAKLQPAAASSLYAAWSALAVPAGRVQVHAARVKAGLFAGNWTGPSTVTNNGSITTSGTIVTTNTTVLTTFQDPTILNAWSTAVPGVANAVAELPLDSTYAQIKPGSWVAIDRPSTNPSAPYGTRVTTFHVVVSLRTGNVATSMPTIFAAKVTLLTLQPAFLSDSQQAGTYETDSTTSAVLRGTVVYAQSEPLVLTDEPLDTDVEGGSIDLANVYDGILPGRFLMVSGVRTDIPNVSGVTASELVMVGGVQQGTQPPLGNPTPPFSTPPFKQVYYTTDADAYGDRLVVGQVSGSFDDFRDTLDKLAAPAQLNQQYQSQVEVATGSFASVYVPTAQEKQGAFSTFAGLLVDPKTNMPFPDGNISDYANRDGLWAFRVSSQALITTLGLATPLSYSYDRGSITIYGNVADATHGQSTGEVLGNGDATKAWLSFALSQSPLTYVSAPTAAGATSSLAVQVNDLQWTELDDFAEAGPNQRGYITRENEAQKTSVVFGSGVRGARVPTGTANVKATYRYGIGNAGNVDAMQISQLATHPLGAQGVINPLPASGGVGPDRLDQARANAPISTVALDRLVSVSDYADFCRTYAGIGKATSVRLSDGRTLTVHVTIAGADDAPIDTGSDLFNNLLTSLQTYGDPYQPVQVAVRRVRLIVMAATVALQPDWAWEDVAPNLTSAVLALFAFDARDLGQPAFQSEAVAALQMVAGVAWVNVTTFDSVPESITTAQLAILGSTLRKQPFIRSELAFVDPRAAPGSPNRIVSAELVFMTSDIPDTLILTQAGG
jgi:hypothetical protein